MRQEKYLKLARLSFVSLVIVISCMVFGYGAIEAEAATTCGCTGGKVCDNCVSGALGTYCADGCYTVPNISYITLDKNPIWNGETTTVRWASSGAEYCGISESMGNYGTSGSQSIGGGGVFDMYCCSRKENCDDFNYNCIVCDHGAVTVTGYPYQCSCDGSAPAGSSICSNWQSAWPSSSGVDDTIWHQVSSCGGAYRCQYIWPAPTCSISWSSASITAPGTATVTWSSTNATSASSICTGPIPGGPTSQALSGSFSFNFSSVQTGTENCTLTVTNAGGATNSCSASIVVNAPPSCTGSIPGFASAWDSEESTGLSASTAWTYSATDTTTKCQYKCSSGFSWNGSACTSVSVSQCTGTIPSNAEYHDLSETTDLSGDTPWTYSASNTATKCQYKCSSGFSWNGSACVPIACSSSIPSGAAAYDAEESTGLTAAASWTYSATDTTTKCQYKCNTNYTWNGSSCVVIPGPTCGSNAVTYAATATAWPSSTAFCSSGTTPNPASPTFPAQGSSTSWTCGTASCTATRNAPAPIDNSTCVSYSGIPGYNSSAQTASVTAGQTFSATVTFQNSGNTTWNQTYGGNGGYKAGSQNPQDNWTWGAGRIGLPSATIAPGANAAFAGTFTAPTTPGTYNFQWRTLIEGVKWFGATCPNVSVTVSAVTCTGTVPTNATLVAGDDTGLSANTPRTLVTANTAAKCEYICNSGYTLSGGVCVSTCSITCSPSRLQCINKQCVSNTISSNICLGCGNTSDSLCSGKTAGAACGTDSNWKEVAP